MQRDSVSAVASIDFGTFTQVRQIVAARLGSSFEDILGELVCLGLNAMETQAKANAEEVPSA